MHLYIKIDVIFCCFIFKQNMIADFIFPILSTRGYKTSIIIAVTFKAYKLLRAPKSFLIFSK